MEILNIFLLFNKEQEELDNLTMFFGVMKNFNNGFSYPRHIYTDFEKFFAYKWKMDNNYAIHTQEDIDLFE